MIYPGSTVNTVLGPVPAAELGAVAVHEALLSVVPVYPFAATPPTSPASSAVHGARVYLRRETRTRSG